MHPSPYLGHDAPGNPTSNVADEQTSRPSHLPASSFSVPPSSRPPLVAPPSSPAARPSSKPVAVSDIPAVKASSGMAQRSASQAQPAVQSKPAQRLMGVEALQKRIETEQKARHKAEEQNMMMRLELGEARKEVLHLKRQVQQLERDLARARALKR